LQDDIDERRELPRRSNDLANTGEIRIFRHELEIMQDKISDVKKQVESDERADDDRLAMLEAKVDEFERKFNFGKGFLYGLVFIVGSVGVYLVDHMKEAIAALGK
jgi:hypothetical protein